MANYCPLARSSYFQVKDPSAFEAFCKRWDLELIRGGEEGRLFGFLCNGEMGIPQSYFDPAQGDYVDGKFFEELAGQLADGWVAIVREIGNEKMRYLVGYTVAVNSRGKSVTVSLDRIYKDAERLGKHMTPCEW